MDKQVRRVCVRGLLSNANEALQTQRDGPQKLVDPKSAYYRIPFCDILQKVQESGSVVLTHQ